MRAITHILTATDLSDPARHAVDRAFRVAGGTAARLTLMHVVSQSAMDTLRQLLGPQTPAMEQRILEDARESLYELAAGLGRARGTAASVHLAAGAALREILVHADAIDASLLVVGARGEGFLRHLLLGATAERLLRKTLRPLLVVRQVPHDDYRRVLVPVDFSAWTLRSIRLARTVAPGAELILFNAFEVPFEGKLRYAGVEDGIIHGYRAAAREDALQGLRRAAGEAGLADGEYRIVPAHGDALPGILEQEEKQDADLIVMGKHGRGMTEELLLGSVTKHVLAQARCDVLIAPR